MVTEIIPSIDMLNQLKDKYDSIDIPLYKFREWFSKEDEVFFDCEDGDLEGCLAEVLRIRDHKFFVTFFVVKDERSNNLKVMNATFRNLGKDTLKRFIERYRSQLKPAGELALGASGIEYLEHIGSSYK